MSRPVRFLIAGVQKGGTTALDGYLRDHPEVQMAATKEAHFFDDESIDWANPDYGRYHALFTEDGRLRGEATPIYLYWPNCLERIARYDPGTRLILLFRDPVGRAWSHWKMERDRGWESEPFAWSVREGRRRVSNDPATPGFHRVFSYVERGLYAVQLERLLKLFPREQLLLLRSDDLSADPDAVLSRVCAFLEVAQPAAVTPRRDNVARDDAPPPEADAAYLRSLYADDVRRFARLSGLDVAGWLTPPGGPATSAAPSAAAPS